jgi:hypothetical protein
MAQATMISRIILLAFVALATGSAQSVPTKHLGPAEAEHTGPWTRIAGVRELRDGRVVVLDAREQALRLVDMKSGSMTPIGRKGSGPGEYLLPLRLLALPGDSSAIFDMANTAAPMVITPSGSPGGVVPGVGARSGAAFISERSETDALGRIYSLRGTPGPDGLYPIERLDRATGARAPVAFVSRQVVSPLNKPAASSRRSAGAGAAARGGRMPPFASAEQWAVAPDGRIALVHPDPYRVTLVAPDGSRTIGALNTVDRVRVTEAEKQLWRERNQQPVASIAYSDGRQTAQYSPPRSYPEPDEWPDYLPAFVIGTSVSFAPDGTLWVSRMVAAKAPPAVDVFGRDARLAYRLVLPPRTRLAGFGSGTVYLVKLDQDDVESLVRYRLPR